MNRTQLCTIDILKSAIRGDRFKSYSDLNFKDSLHMGLKHDIFPLMYFGLMNVPGFRKSSYYSDYKKNIVSCQKKDFEYIDELNTIKRAFDDEGIDYMPIKGTYMKNIYARSVMRTSGKIDLVVRPEQVRDAVEVVGKLGFRVLDHGRDGFMLRKNNDLYLELYVHMFNDRTGPMYDYFKSCWEFAEPISENSHEYEMDIENTLIYLFCYFVIYSRENYKALTWFIDLFVYMTAFPDFDSEFVRNQIKQFGLFDYYVNTLKTLDCWFNNTMCTTTVDFMTNVMFKYGVRD